MSYDKTKLGGLRVSLSAVFSLGGVLLSGCAVLAPPGPDFHAMSSYEHRRAACDLQKRAKRLAGKFDPSAKALLRPAIPPYTRPGERITSLPSDPKYYNPTARYLVMARDLLLRAERHMAAIRQRAAGDVCKADGSQFRSYGSSFGWW